MGKQCFVEFYVEALRFPQRHILSLCLSSCSWSCPRLAGAEMGAMREAWQQTVPRAASQSGEKKYTDWEGVPHSERDMLYFKTTPLIRLQGTSAPGAATVHVVNIGLFSKETKCFPVITTNNTHVAMKGWNVVQTYAFPLLLRSVLHWIHRLFVLYHNRRCRIVWTCLII